MAKLVLQKNGGFGGKKGLLSNYQAPLLMPFYLTNAQCFLVPNSFFFGNHCWAWFPSYFSWLSWALHMHGMYFFPIGCLLNKLRELSLFINVLFLSAMAPSLLLISVSPKSLEVRSQRLVFWWWANYDDLNRRSFALKDKKVWMDYLLSFWLHWTNFHP